jgi:hypothetical protein
VPLMERAQAIFCIVAACGMAVGLRTLQRLVIRAGLVFTGFVSQFVAVLKGVCRGDRIFAVEALMIFDMRALPVPKAQVIAATVRGLVRAGVWAAQRDRRRQGCA